ncbi:hypothetical protein LSAT2_020765 [Lamellibrachia satsuma]|nr:hypothetical protein LSAT2_020765 [Lamellibrachia satsuma]
MKKHVEKQEKQTAAEEKRKEKRAKSFIAPVETDVNKSSKKQQKDVPVDIDALKKRMKNVKKRAAVNTEGKCEPKKKKVSV